MPSEEAVCITLTKYAYPKLLENMEWIFGKHFSIMSKTVWHVSRCIMRKFKHLLKINGSNVIPEIATEFMATMSAAGCLLPHCIGLIDGRVRGICKPTRNERQFYSGYKKRHALNFQAVCAPNGHTIDLHGERRLRRTKQEVSTGARR